MSIKEGFMIFTSSIIVLSVCFALLLEFSRTKTMPITQAIVATFTNSENVSVTIRSFPNQMNRLFSGLGYVDLPMVATTAASGVRYVNEEVAIEVWDKGTELAVFRAGDQVFLGVAGTIPKVNSDTEDYEPIVFTEAITNYTWQWLPPHLDQTVAESFTLKHERDGSVLVTTDCNSYTGTYTLTNDKKINYLLPVSTQQDCSDPSHEKKFIELLEQSTAANILETMQLELIQTDGMPPMTFGVQLIPML